LPTRCARERAAPESGIVEVANYGRAAPGSFRSGSGRGRSADAGVHLRGRDRGSRRARPSTLGSAGIPDLRKALARYHAVYGRDFSAEEFYVTGSGMQAIQIVIAMLAG
jgi:DNA-binding transcriptional MocR family regulator